MKSCLMLISALRSLLEAIQMTRLLRVFPGHAAILSSSPYCHSQLVRWQQGEPDSNADEADTQPPSSKRRKLSSRRQVVLTLQDAGEEPAAVAVLEALYAVKPISMVLSKLSQEQQLQAALLADLWQISAISKGAVQLLLEAAGSDDAGLTAAVQDRFMALKAYPACLLPLLKPVVAAGLQTASAGRQAKVKQLLLSVLGDLEEVWADELLQHTLLQLPLSAMELLLSCDELKVTSEDNVLYTAQVYVNMLTNREQQQARQRLAPLIRCPLLDLFWLTAFVLSSDAPTLLLSSNEESRARLKRLLSLRVAQPIRRLTAETISLRIPDAPASWSLKQRALVEDPRGVKLTFSLGVDALKTAVQRSIQSRQPVDVEGGAAVSAPLGGIAFTFMFRSKWTEDPRNVELNALIMPNNIPRDTVCTFDATLQCEQHKAVHEVVSHYVEHGYGCGWSDFFQTGDLSGGWDDAAWAAQGLPTSGDLTFILHVTSVHGRKGGCPPRWLK